MSWVCVTCGKTRAGGNADFGGPCDECKIVAHTPRKFEGSAEHPHGYVKDGPGCDHDGERGRPCPRCAPPMPFKLMIFKHCFHETTDLLRTPGGVREKCCFCGTTQDLVRVEKRIPPAGHGQYHPNVILESGLSPGNNDPCPQRNPIS